MGIKEVNVVGKNIKEEILNRIYESYIRILEINLTEDTYLIVKSDESEHTKDRGFSTSLSGWFEGIGTTGQIHPDDYMLFKANTDMDFLRNYFKQNDRNLHIRYRRIIGREFRWVGLEIYKTYEYTDDNQVLILLVKDIHDESVVEIETQRELERNCNYDQLTKLRNYFSYQNMCVHYGMNRMKRNVGAVFADLNGLKLINDTKGHDIGNNYIVSFVELLKEFFADYPIFRISGDEFIVVLLECGYEELSERVNQLIEKINDTKVPIASVGFAWQENVTKIERIVREAEENMYEQKKCFYSAHPDYSRTFVEQQYHKEMAAVIDDIAKNYPTIGVINVENDSYRMIKYDPSLGKEVFATTYTEYANIFLNNIIAPESRGNIEGLTGIVNLRNILKDKTYYTFHFKVASGAWRQITYRRIEGLDEKLKTVVFYASELNSFITENLNKGNEPWVDYEIMEGLARDYSLIARVTDNNSTVRICKQTEWNKEFTEAIKTYTYDELREWFANYYIKGEGHDSFIKNTDLSFIRKKLETASTFSMYYYTKCINNADKFEWSQLIFYKPIDGRDGFVFAIKYI